MSEPRAELLLVDDQEPNLTALEAILQGSADALVKARSGTEALRCLLERDFAAVLLDVNMPGMDGFEAAQLIRGRDRSRATPILFVTAVHQAEEDVLRGYALGAVDYVFKPIAPAILRSKVAVFVELHRRRERETAARAELARSNEELAQFAHVVAHDLQAPLRSVVGHLDLLARRAGEALDEKARGFLGSARTDAERMKTQIRDLLAYARVKEGEPVREAVDCAAVVQRSLERLRVALEEAGAEVTHGPLPVVVADPTLLAQLFQNLLDNAVKFRGAAAPRVHVAAEARGAEWRFSVADNGIGIDPRDKERIFAVFQRLHGRDEYPGNGIGLAVCRKIVERCGGRIGVESKPGEGSTFFFTLPRTP